MIIPMLFISSHSFAADKHQCKSNETASIKLLTQRVAKEHLYRDLNCLSFYPENCNAKYVDIAVREIHNKHCGGDSSTTHIRDRFRVTRHSTLIQRYDIVEGEYIAFGADAEYRGE